MPTSRRRFLIAGSATVAIAVTGCSDEPPSSGDTPTDGSPPQADPSPNATPTAGTQTSNEAFPETVVARRMASGFTSPVGFETVPGRPGEWIVVDQDGCAWLYDGSEIGDEPFLDVTDRMVSINGGYDERGLLGLAFHPEFATNGTLYVRYSAPKRDGTPSDYSHTFVLAEFSTDPDANTVPTDSERTVLEIPQPQSNHNAGSVLFGPDGYCYIGVGDGGGGGDTGPGHVDDWYEANDGGNGQDVEANLLGSVLRIDVDPEDEKGYAIPADNPLVGGTGRDEHYAWGLRNPWRMSFDGGDLYAADVGQNRYEEIDLVRPGGNYGWNVREATHCYNADSCPGESPDGDRLRDPIVEYSHSGDPPSGQAVIGGYRYRGDALGGLSDTYVFADWQLQDSLFVAEPVEGGLWPVSVVDVEREEGGQLGSFALAFGRTHRDELTICTTDESGPRGSSGAVYRLVGTA
jgi:glucose/arabinose dehydrogenase